QGERSFPRLGGRTVRTAGGSAARGELTAGPVAEEVAEGPIAEGPIAEGAVGGAAGQRFAVDITRPPRAGPARRWGPRREFRGGPGGRRFRRGRRSRRLRE